MSTEAAAAEPTGTMPLPAAPVVSIVTPSFNQGAFIEETLRSVLSQRGDFSLDYIVIDGGSTDATMDIVKKYDKLLSDSRWPVACRGIRYRWLSEKDRGQTDAIAKGFARAEGHILAWLNSDDVYSEDAIQKAVSVFRERRDADVVYGTAAYINEHGEAVGRYPAEPFDGKRLAVVDFICQPSTFFTRSAYDRSGGVNVDLRYAMDYDLWIRMAQQGSFVYFPEVLSYYRLHGESKTVAPHHALENHRECLRTVVRHFHWAPVNRVVGYAYHSVKNASPAFISRRPWMVLFGALPVALFLYFRFNTWIRLDDIRLITPRTIRKLLAMERLFE